MAIEATITLDELKRTVALVEEAYAKGYTASVAILALASGGRHLDECVLVADGLLLRSEDGMHDLGNQSSAKHFRDLTKNTR